MELKEISDRKINSMTPQVSFDLGLVEVGVGGGLLKSFNLLGVGVEVEVGVGVGPVNPNSGCGIDRFKYLF